MFITLTIDTKQKQKIRINKSKINVASGWREAVHTKKRSFHHKIAVWKRSWKMNHYKLDGQTAMF